MVNKVALGLIRFYQRWISSLTPPSCFFYPTCSHYTYQAIERFGLWRGGWLGLGRVCRCHPLARGGYDPVPEKWLFWPRRNGRDDIRDDGLKNDNSENIRQS